MDTVKLPELPPIPAVLLDILVKTRNRPTHYMTVIGLIKSYARAAVQSNIEAAMDAVRMYGGSYTNAEILGMPRPAPPQPELLKDALPLVAFAYSHGIVGAEDVGRRVEEALARAAVDASKANVEPEAIAAFRKWWLDNVPEGTVIGKPEWWLSRIVLRLSPPERGVLQAAPKAEAVEGG